jgi:hypothetical protein
MAETSRKREAQRRVDRIQAFRAELEQLSRDGAIGLSPEQSARLDAHLDNTLADLAARFDVDVSRSQKQISLAMRIASALGGLAFCAAVFLFFYRYWGLLSTGLQVAIAVTIPILGLVAVEWVSRKEKTLYYTSLLVLVVLAAFIMNLTVLGSIFNIAPSPYAFLAWGILALIPAYAYNLRLPLAGALISLTIFVAALIVSSAGGYWGALANRPESILPGGAVLLALSGLLRNGRRPEFPAVYRTIGLLFIFLAFLLLSNRGQATYLPWSRNAVEGIHQMAGFAAAVASIWIGVRRNWMECVNLGSGFFAIYLFNRLFAWWWDWMPKYIFFLIIGCIALALLAAFRRLRRGSVTLEAV